jgi:DNA polymerase III alpha subunit
MADKGGPSATRKPKILEAVAAIKAEFLGANPKKLAIAWEKFYMGVPLTGSLVELYSNPRVDTKLRNLLRLRPGTYNLGVVIEGIKKFKDKKGNWMCFLTLSDETYMMNTAVMFSKAYNDNAWILEEGKPVFINGRKDKDSFFVNKIEHL